MYCQYCGAMIPDEAKICMGCGCPVPPTPRYGAAPMSPQPPRQGPQPMPFDMNPESVPYDGAPVGTPASEPMVSPRSGLVTLILLLILGHMGLHRFYVGKVGSGLGMLALCLVSAGFIFSFWALDWGLDICSPWDLHLSPFLFMSRICSLALIIWWVVDLIHIVTSKFTDSQGRTIKL